MKKYLIPKIFAVMLVLVMISGSVVSGTFAKFTTEVTGTGTAVVAKWEPEFKAGTTTVTKDSTFDLFSTRDPNTAIDDNVIAPGATGSFKLVYDAKSTEVDSTVGITFEKEDSGFDIVFYLDNGSGTKVPITPSGDVYEVLKLGDETVKHGATGDDRIVEVTVYWEWVFEVNDATDIIDTAAGVAALAATDPVEIITVTFTATQVEAGSGDSGG